MKVLYVEDSRLDAELLCKELQQPGRFDILVAGSLQEGRERIDRDQGYDLVLVDMALPDGNGLELLSEIRKRALPLAVVVLTGSGDEESAVAALKAGADDYVVKSEGTSAASFRPWMIPCPLPSRIRPQIASPEGAVCRAQCRRCGSRGAALLPPRPAHPPADGHHGG